MRRRSRGARRVGERSQGARGSRPGRCSPRRAIARSRRGGSAAIPTRTARKANRRSRGASRRWSGTTTTSWRSRRRRAPAVASTSRAAASAPITSTCAFYLTLVPIRPRWRGERRSLRTSPGASLRPGSLAFNPRPRRLSTPLLTPFNSTPTSLRMDNYPQVGRQRRDEPDRRLESVRRRRRVAEHRASARREQGERVRPRDGRRRRRRRRRVHGCHRQGLGRARPLRVRQTRVQAEGISHWSPYDRVGVVNADP
jgi:hypothetical protein